MTDSPLPALADTTRDATIAKAVELMVAGKTIRDIAAETNIPRTTIHGWLLAEVGPDYRSIQEQGLIARVLLADEELDAARDHVAISRARERCKFYRWDLERRVKRLFSPSAELSGPGGGPIVLDDRMLMQRFRFVTAMVQRGTGTAPGALIEGEATAAPSFDAESTLSALAGKGEDFFSSIDFPSSP